MISDYSNTYISIVLAAVLTGSITQLAHAEEQSAVHPYLTEKFSVDVGIFYPEREFGIQVNSTITGPSEPIDFEGDVGARLSDELFSLNFAWRFGEKWQLEGQYFAASGSRGATLEEDVEWKNVVFLAGTGVKAGQNFSVFRTFFARRFESGEKHEFGVGGGLHWLKFGAFIEGNITTSEGAVVFDRESVEALAPLPNIGVWYMYSVSPKLALTTRVDWLDVTIKQYGGALTNASIGLNYQVFEHAGIGLNYNAFNLDITIDKTDWRGKASISYEGLYAYLSFYW
jgi:hypothetical protein